MNLPKSRSANILTQELETETLIYDLLTDRAYTLNETARTVFNACGSGQTFADLKRRLNYTDELIHLTLAELERHDLLADEYLSPDAEISRREVIRKVGLATMIALPVIASITAPQAANAASGALLANGQRCGSNAVCQSSRCDTTGRCCQVSQQGACTVDAECCEAVPCTNGVCCAGVGSFCTTNNLYPCCAGLTCIPDGGVLTGFCQ